MTARPPARIVPYPSGRDIAASRDFYVETLGLQVTMESPVLCLSSSANPSAQVILSPPGLEVPQPSFGVDLGDPQAVDAAHAEALRRGLRIVYPLTDESWGVHRFFVEDPGGTIVNVLAHVPPAAP
jgi:catechol 2,3-dioxygenase-like lactoylglutathione lyase family enzyme